MYLSLQFQMSKTEREIYKFEICCSSNLSINDDIISQRPISGYFPFRMHCFTFDFKSIFS